MADVGVRPLRFFEIKNHWRDLLELDIKDPALKKHVEKFLDKLESSAFGLDMSKIMTGQRSKPDIREMSGQNILGNLAQMKSQLTSHPDLFQALEKKGMIHNGKFIIADHNRPYDHQQINGSNTIGFTSPGGGSLPIKIEIGTDYLKGAKFTGLDGKKHPVTVDGVVAHELVHLAYASRNEELAMTAETIISGAMGGPMRANDHTFYFQKNSNGGYQTLYDKIGRPRASLEIPDPAVAAAVPPDKMSAFAMNARDLTALQIQPLVAGLMAPNAALPMKM